MKNNKILIFIMLTLLLLTACKNIDEIELNNTPPAIELLNTNLTTDIPEYIFDPVLFDIRFCIEDMTRVYNNYDYDDPYFDDRDFLDFVELKTDNTLYKSDGHGIELGEVDINVYIENMTIKAFDIDYQVIDEATYNNIMLYNAAGQKSIPIIKNAEKVEMLWVYGTEELTDISNINQFHNLKYLDIDGLPQISNLSALGELNNLQCLNFETSYDGKIDISSLEKLTLLKELSLISKIRTLNIEDISSLATLKKLKSLEIVGCSTKDIVPISNLKQLEYLRLSNFPELTDLSPISGLEQLTEVSLWKLYNVESIQPLSTLKNLKELHVGDLDISDISPIANLNRLEYFELGESKVNSLEPLANLKKLEVLELDKPKNLETIEQLTRLKTLILGNTTNGSIYDRPEFISNNLSDISNLSALSNLESLTILRSKISDISVISDLTNLNYLCLQGNNEIVSFNPVSNLHELVVLNVMYNYSEESNSNKLEDISFLQNLSNLKRLGIELTDVNDYSLINELKNLEYLHITDADEKLNIQNLHKLTEFRIRHSSINMSQLPANIKELYLRSIIKDSNLNCENIVKLELWDYQLQTLPNLGELNELKSLNLKSCYELRNIDALAFCPNLEYLDISATKIKDVNSLAELSKLKKIYAHSTEITDVNELADLHELIYLELICCESFSDVTPLSNLDNLVILNIDGCNISDLSNIENKYGLTIIQN